MARPLLTSRIATLYELQAVFVEPTLKSLGIGWGTFQLLTAAHASGGQEPQAEIARRLGVAPATLCESVQSHVKRGLLEQVASSTDKRVKVLRLTPRAESLVRQVLSDLEEAEAQMLAGVTATAQRTASATLDRCIENLERVIGRR